MEIWCPFTHFRCKKKSQVYVSALNSAACNEKGYQVWEVSFVKNTEISCHSSCWGQAFIRQRQCHTPRRPLPESPRNIPLIYIWDDRLVFLHYTEQNHMLQPHWNQSLPLCVPPSSSTLNSAKVTAFDISKLFQGISEKPVDQSGFRTSVQSII